jgi:hypothetical protein
MRCAVVLLLSVLSLSACTVSPVTVEQRPLEITAGEMPDRASAMHDGLTQWFFHCHPQFTCDVVPNADPNAVTVRIRTVRMKIGLSVVQQLPKGSTEKLVQHEDGHLAICKRVYSTAKSVAEACCQDVLGKEFSAYGTDPKQAEQNALKEAAASMCAAYTRRTADVASDVSAAYDNLTAHGVADATPAEAIERAFKEVSQVSVGRRI